MSSRVCVECDRPKLFRSQSGTHRCYLTGLDSCGLQHSPTPIVETNQIRCCLCVSGHLHLHRRQYMAGRAACELALITIHPKIVNLRTNCSRLRVEVVVSFIQSVDAKGKRVMKALANPMTGAQKEGSFDMMKNREEENDLGPSLFAYTWLARRRFGNFPSHIAHVISTISLTACFSNAYRIVPCEMTVTQTCCAARNPQSSQSKYTAATIAPTRSPIP